jgi:hypothetical protein
MWWCFPKGRLQVVFKICFFSDIIFKVLPIRLLNVLDEAPCKGGGLVARVRALCTLLQLSKS